MRKICLISCSLLLLSLVGCGNNTAQTPKNKAYVNNQTTVAQVLAEQTGSTKTNTPEATSGVNVEKNNTLQDVSQESDVVEPVDSTMPTDQENMSDVNVVGSDVEKTYNKVDVNLSAMSPSLVYSEVLNIMTDPDNYCGKTIKMSGLFASILDGDDNNTYLACIIQDATACCAQGIEFQPFKPDLKNKDVGSLEGKNITVVGTFDKYNVGGNTYYSLKDARILQLD